MRNALGAYSKYNKYAPGAAFIQNMLLDIIFGQISQKPTEEDQDNGLQSSHVPPPPSTANPQGQGVTTFLIFPFCKNLTGSILCLYVLISIH